MCRLFKKEQLKLCHNQLSENKKDQVNNKDMNNPIDNHLNSKDNKNSQYNLPSEYMKFQPKLIMMGRRDKCKARILELRQE